MALTSYGNQQALKGVFGGSPTTPATLYFGLSTTAVGIDGSGITEPSGNAYARVAVTNSVANFPVTQIALGSGGGAEAKNGTVVTFPQSTGSWGTVTHWFASDASTAGNVLAYGQLSASQVVGANNTLSFAVNALTIQDV